MSDNVYQGEEQFTEGLRLSLDENASFEEKNTLFLKAINKGLPVDDEWMAYLFLSHGYQKLSNDSGALSAFQCD